MKENTPNRSHFFSIWSNWKWTKRNKLVFASKILVNYSATHLGKFNVDAYTPSMFCTFVFTFQRSIYWHELFELYRLIKYKRNKQRRDARCGDFILIFWIPNSANITQPHYIMHYHLQFVFVFFFKYFSMSNFRFRALKS